MLKDKLGVLVLMGGVVILGKGLVRSQSFHAVIIVCYG